jgi:hypothetical protein
VKHFSNRGCENRCCNDGMTPPALTDSAPQATSCALADAAGGGLALKRRCETSSAFRDGRIAPPKGGTPNGGRSWRGAKTLHFVPKLRWLVEHRCGTPAPSADFHGKTLQFVPKLGRKAPGGSAGALRPRQRAQRAMWIRSKTRWRGRRWRVLTLRGLCKMCIIQPDSRFRTGPALGTSLDRLDAKVAGGAQISTASPEKLCVSVRKLRKVALSSAGFARLPWEAIAKCAKSNPCFARRWRGPGLLHPQLRHRSATTFLFTSRAFAFTGNASHSFPFE